LARGLCFVAFAFLFLDTSLGNRGLLFAFLAATMAGAMFSFAAATWRGLHPFRLKQIRLVFSHYSDFPFKAAIPAMLDLVALAAPLLAISRLYSLDDAAMFGLFRQAITAPFSLMATAFGQVLTRQLAELIASKQHVYRLVLNTFVVLCTISGTIAAAVLLEGPEIFRVVYGSRWPQAGTIAAILVIPAACQFVASALSGALIALRSLAWLAFWQISYFLFVCLLIYMDPPSMMHFVYGLAAIDVILSLAYLVIIARVVLSYERSGCELFARTT
jgi:O-antigen/teichoic acid export membrane protein